MKRNGKVLLIWAVLVVGICEILFHWLLVRGMFSRLLAIYLLKDYPSGKLVVADVLDNDAPAAILGFVNGWVGFSRWSVRTMAATALGLAVFVAGLMPIYSALMGSKLYLSLWGAPPIQQSLHNLPFVFILTGGCTCAAYQSRKHWERKKARDMA